MDEHSGTLRTESRFIIRWAMRVKRCANCGPSHSASDYSDCVYAKNLINARCLQVCANGHLIMHRPFT
jgi:hypothetical protein